MTSFPVTIDLIKRMTCDCMALKRLQMRIGVIARDLNGKFLVNLPCIRVFRAVQVDRINIRRPTCRQRLALEKRQARLCADYMDTTEFLG